jgi:hypothetical protein
MAAAILEVPPVGLNTAEIQLFIPVVFYHAACVKSNTFVMVCRNTFFINRMNNLIISY